jgi:predicted Zn-dependent protease
VVSTSRPEVTGERAQVALALADDVVARALAGGATEAEALVTAEDAALTRFANSEIHQNVAETNIGVNLRFCVGRRIAVAATGRTDDDGLRALVERAATIAASVEELEDWGGLPP